MYEYILLNGKTKNEGPSMLAHCIDSGSLRTSIDYKGKLKRA